LSVADCANGSGASGESLYHHVMVVFDNFPEKGGAMGEHKGRKVLKKRHFSTDIEQVLNEKKAFILH
jgi:hypothetical protein